MAQTGCGRARQQATCCAYPLGWCVSEAESLLQHDTQQTQLRYVFARPVCAAGTLLSLAAAGGAPDQLLEKGGATASHAVLSLHSIPACLLHLLAASCCCFSLVPSSLSHNPARQRHRRLVAASFSTLLWGPRTNQVFIWCCLFVPALAVVLCAVHPPPGCVFAKRGVEKRGGGCWARGHTAPSCWWCA